MGSAELVGGQAHGSVVIPRQLRKDTGADMHGLIFVTWEKYLAERFGTSLLQDYRRTIGQGVGEAPLASRVYDDEHLLAGVAAASRLTRTDVDVLLRDYGRFFMLNGLTSRLCSYLLDQVHGGRDLLLAMNNAHEQMHQADVGVTPPLFQYGAIPGDPTGLYLIYDSPRQLCSLLLGTIEGSALRYGERVRVTEETCMKRGAPMCTFAIHFLRPSTPLHRRTAARTGSRPVQTLWSVGGQGAQREAEHLLADAIYAILPDTSGLTLSEVQDRLRQGSPDIADAARPFLVLEALNHLHHAGWVATSANEPGDTLSNRRYWRVAPVGR